MRLTDYLPLYCIRNNQHNQRTLSTAAYVLHEISLSEKTEESKKVETERETRLQ